MSLKSPLRTLLLSAALTSLPVLSMAAELADKDAARAEGRELSQQFLAGATGPIWTRMTDQMQQALGNQERLAAFTGDVETQLGEETEVTSETVEQVQGHWVYVRTSKWSKAPGPVAMQWALTDSGDVAGFYVRPASAEAAAAE